jgi:DNA-binding transcriptional LysR family regulator
MEIRHLRYFIAVAEELNFSRAAERLGVAQPPLSRQIRDLEKELGFQLFSRSTTSVELTDPGRVFRSRAETILASIQEAIVTTQRIAAGSPREFRIGVDWNKPFLPIAAVARTFREKIPTLAIRIVELPGSQHLRSLRDQTIDLGFVSKFVLGSRTGMESALVFSGEFRVVLSASHSLANQPFVRLRDLKLERWIIPAGFPDYRGLLTQIFRPNRFVPRFGRTARYIAGMLAAAENEEGVALIPEAALPPEPPGVRYLKADAAILEVMATWSKQKTNVHVTRYVQLLQQSIAQAATDKK